VIQYLGYQRIVRYYRDEDTVGLPIGVFVSLQFSPVDRLLLYRLTDRFGQEAIMFRSNRLSSFIVLIVISIFFMVLSIHATAEAAVEDPGQILPNGRHDHNDTPDSATVISLPHEGDYSIDPAGDVDWYRMHIDANSLILFYTERINDSQLDPRAIFYGPHDESGNDVDPTSWIFNDDDSHGDLQPEIRCLITETGYYFLRISYYQDVPTGNPVPEQKEGIKSETGEYRLFAEILPSQPNIIYSPNTFDFAMAPEETDTQILTISNQGTIDLDVISITDDQLIWLDEDPINFILPPDSSQDVEVIVDATGLTEGSYSADITITCNDPDDSLITIPVVLTLAFPDSNETPETSTLISVPHQEDYALAPAGDVDWYKMHLDVGTTWLIYSERIFDSLVDPEVYLYGPHSESGGDVDSMDWIANDDDTHGDRQFEILVEISETGYYFLRVASFLDDPTSLHGGEPGSQKALTGAYRLIINPGSDADDALPATLRLFSVYPNPAKNMIQLSFNVSSEASVKISIYDLSGKLLRIPVNENMVSGRQVRTFSTQALTAGSYVVRLQTDNTEYSHPLLIVR
jgi:hypothetical protein